MYFFEKLSQAIADNHSLLVASLDPNPEILGSSGDRQPVADKIEALRAWLQSAIAGTQDQVCAYKLGFGYYEALGAAGLDLLLEILQQIPRHIPTILDAKHGDLNSSTVFARTLFEEWEIDSLTLSPYAGQDHAAAFLVYPDKGVFILCRTSNPGAITLQEYPNLESPYYLHLVEEVKTWGPPEQVYLEVGAANPTTIARIRTAAPERTILLRSLWKEGGNLRAILQAGLDSHGQGLLIPIAFEMLQQRNLVNQLQSLNELINGVRQETAHDSSCDLWTPDLCLLAKHPHQDLILQLYDLGCILFGEYVQASGEVSSHYIDLRKVISNPQVFHQVVSAYAKILKTLNFDRIAGIPYGALPTATGLSLTLHQPMVFPRKEVKAHGTRRLIEGYFVPGEKVVVVDDVLISGNSAMEGAEKLKSAGLRVEDIVVFIDRGGGAPEKLQQQGYRAHAVLTLNEIAAALYEAGRINRQQWSCLTSSP